MKERLEAAVADAAAFVERWSAKSLETIEPTSLRALLRELADIRAARSEARQWAFMLTKTDSENPAVLDIRAWVDIRSPRLDDAIRHFELAWMALPDDRARALAEDEAVARDRHYLLGVRRFRPFMLSQAEERVLSARDASAVTAWQTLRDRTLGSLSARFDDGTGEREWPLSELESARRARGHSPWLAVAMKRPERPWTFPLDGAASGAGPGGGRPGVVCGRHLGEHVQPTTACARAIDSSVAGPPAQHHRGGAPARRGRTRHTSR